MTPDLVLPLKARPGDRIAVLSPSFAAAGAFPAVHEQAMRRLTEVTGLIPVEYPTTREVGATPAARAAGVAPTSRVVGYSTGISPVSSVSRRIACSCTTGNAPAAANEGEMTAMRSPGRAFGGWTRSSVIPGIQAHRTASLHL